MQIAEFLTARTMGLCLVFQSMPSPLFLLLLLHLDSCLCWCSLEKSVPTVLTAPGEVITSSSGSKLHSHKVSSFLHPLLYLFIYLFVCLFGWREAHKHCTVVRKQSVGIESLLPLCEFWGLNPGHLQAWCQAPLPTEPRASIFALFWNRLISPGWPWAWCVAEDVLEFLFFLPLPPKC